MKNIILVSLLITLIYANPLQDAIDRATPYSTIYLQNGIYQGNVTIDKPLSIIGKGSSVVISGDSKGSVITITSSHVKLDNLTIQNSGKSMIDIDSAVSLKRVEGCSITNCRIQDTLYGIDMNMVNDTNITNNTISSYREEKAFRGDAIKIWYSNRNRVENNTITECRDVTLSFSNYTTIRKNNISQGRHALAMERSNHTTIESNRFNHNSTSIILTASSDTNITDNKILSSSGAAGIGVVIMGGGVARFLSNQISFNAKAFYIDTKDHEEGMRRYFIDNTISYNKEAFHFHLTIKNNTIVGNRIVANIDDVIRDIEGAKTRDNRIERNYWDRYGGFDIDGDGVGDTPHRVYQYADWLWQYDHRVKFFYASVSMSLLNFLSQLAPFISPNMLLEDNSPLIHDNQEI